MRFCSGQTPEFEDSYSVDWSHYYTALHCAVLLLIKPRGRPYRAVLCHTAPDRTSVDGSTSAFHRSDSSALSLGRGRIIIVDIIITTVCITILIIIITITISYYCH